MIKKLALLSLSFFALTACKKESTCRCTQVYTQPAYYDNNNVFHQEYKYITQFTNTWETKKKDITSTCKKNESIKSTPSTNSNQGPTVEVITCEVL